MMIMFLSKLFSPLFLWSSSKSSSSSSSTTSPLTMDTTDPGRPLDTTMVQQSPPLHKLYIAIPSMIEDRDRRQAIRDTWAATARHHNCPLHFYLGTSNCRHVNAMISAESNQHKDIIITHYEDLWNNKVKKLFEAMQRSVHGPESSEYFMFVEDSTMVHLPQILQWLTHNGTPRLYAGRVNYHNRPSREPNSIYYISPNALPDPTFPPYCESVGWWMGRETVVALLSQRLSRLMLHIDDVTVGCWLARMREEGKFEADLVNVGHHGIGVGGHLMVPNLTPADMHDMATGVGVGNADHHHEV